MCRRSVGSAQVTSDRVLRDLWHCRWHSGGHRLDAAHNSGETTPGFNVLIHALGDAGVLALLTVPALESWVNGHVMAGAG